MNKEEIGELKRGMEIEVRDKRFRYHKIIAKGNITSVIEHKELNRTYVHLDTGYFLIVHL